MSDKKGVRPPQMAQFVKVPERKLVFWPPKDEAMTEPFDPRKWVECNEERAPVHPDFLDIFARREHEPAMPKDPAGQARWKDHIQREIFRARDERPFHLIFEKYGWEAMNEAYIAVNKYLASHRVVDPRRYEQEEEERKKKEEEERKKKEEEERRKAHEEEEDELDLFKKYGFEPTHEFPPDDSDDFEMEPIDQEYEF